MSTPDPHPLAKPTKVGQGGEAALRHRQVARPEPALPPIYRGCDENQMSAVASRDRGIQAAGSKLHLKAKRSRPCSIKNPTDHQLFRSLNLMISWRS